MADPMPPPLDFETLALETADLADLGRELLQSEAARRDGRAARTLVKSPDLTAVLTAVPKGGSVGEHAAAGPVVIVTVIGTAIFRSGSESAPGRPVSTGQALFIGRGRPHQVEAAEDCAFLILIGAQS